LLEFLISLLETSRGWNAAALALVLAALYMLIAHVAWRMAHTEPTAELRVIMQQPRMRALYEGLRLGYYVGVPFWALYFGWVDLRSIGLGLLDWADGVRYAIVILLAAWLLLIIIWLPYLRATAKIYAPPASQLSFPRRIVEIIYMQAHWAFYRAAAIVFLNGVIADSYYWGSILGLGLILLEAFANPQIRQQLLRVGEADRIVWNVGQAVLNTLAFLGTRNLLLLVLIQFALEITVPHLRATAPPLPASTRQRISA